MIIIFSLFLGNEALSATSKSSVGLIKLKSQNSVKLTLDRMQSQLEKKGMTIFARVNHGKGARSVGQKLRETQLLIFGNPKIGTKLMNCNQSAGIDLPQKALAWKDEKGDVWLAYNNPIYFAKRHKIEKCAKNVLIKISKALAKFAAFASGSL